MKTTSVHINSTAHGNFQAVKDATGISLKRLVEEASVLLAIKHGIKAKQSK